MRTFILETICNRWRQIWNLFSETLESQKGRWTLLIFCLSLVRFPKRISFSPQSAKSHALNTTNRACLVILSNSNLCCLSIRSWIRNKEEKLFQSILETVWDNSERAFGVQRADWHISIFPSVLSTVDTIADFTHCELIFHNISVCFVSSLSWPSPSQSEWNRTL